MELQKDGRSKKGAPLCKRGHIKEFGKDCRECNRERCRQWSEENKSKELERHRVYYSENREGMLAKMRSRRQDPEAKSADSVRQKRWKAQNREHVNAESRKRYREIKEVHAKRVRSWKDRNPEVWREINNAAKNRRRARLKEAIGSHTRAEWRAILAKFKHVCAYCGRAGRLEKDHIIPLSLGGSDMAVNLQPLCRQCNGNKSATIAEGTQLGIFDKVVG